MQPEIDDSAVQADAAIQADAYIDALLTGHRRLPVVVTADQRGTGPLGRQPGVRDTIRLLEKGLPRFHPSFLFEEWLSEQLRRAATSGSAEALGAERRIGRIVPIAVIPREQALGRIQDRRLLVGGAIASGVSIAGAAVIAWRRSRTPMEGRS